jgi:TusA-related sulfurtransferase
LLKAFLFSVWNETKDKEVLVIETDKEKATIKLSYIISENEDYELTEEFDYDRVLI